MVVIRLSRGGSKKTPFFNLVVADSRNRRDGRFIERVGFYNPSASGDAEALRVDQARVSYWTGAGAQLSDTVRRLVKLHATGPEGMAKAKAKDDEKTIAKKATIAAAAKAEAETDAAKAEEAKAQKTAAVEASTEAETPAEEAVAEPAADATDIPAAE